VISRGEYISKIRAAVAARESKDFVIIARTDARAMISFDEAIDRANAALDAGADIAFVEAVQTLDEIEAVPRRVKGACMLNVVTGGKTPLLNLRDVQQMGYRLTILPGILLKATIEACDNTLQALRETNMPTPGKSGATVADTFRRFGADEWNELRKRFQDA
jgi:2-methylisocitrate lyase-like PEP mutase family enzyme